MSTLVSQNGKGPVVGLIWYCHGSQVGSSMQISLSARV